MWGGKIAKGFVSTTVELEKAVLVGLKLKRKPTMWDSDDSLKELGQLAESVGATVLDHITQKIERPTATYLGKGKLETLVDITKSLSCTVAIFDDELTPAQQRNLEDILKIKVIDRTALILDAFARRARTHEGQLQVELAQHEYLLPRLAGQWSHLERLGGGIGTRGPGETQLETDRRIVRRKIQQIRKEIESVRRQRELHRRHRKNVGIPVVALVGYTNAGKSTLFNMLVGSEVARTEDVPFSTLDPVTRQIVLTDSSKVLLTDTVGFIQKLPHSVIAAFRATLEELQEASLILHVVDISHHNAPEQVQVVVNTLNDLQLQEKPKLLVLNKIDKVSDSQKAILLDTSDAEGEGVFISASNGWGKEILLQTIDESLYQSPFTESRH